MMGAMYERAAYLARNAIAGSTRDGASVALCFQFRRQPSLSGDSMLAMRSPAGASSPCCSAVVRDGLRIYPFTGANPPDLDKIFAEQLAGIELYQRSASVPAELRDAGSCGALVLSTR